MTTPPLKQHPSPPAIPFSAPPTSSNTPTVEVPMPPPDYFPSDRGGAQWPVLPLFVSMRDIFAIIAEHRLIHSLLPKQDIGKACYEIADSMMAARDNAVTKKGV